MGWGILGASAIDAYTKAQKTQRDQQWEDQQRAEWLRQTQQAADLDKAANGGMDDPTQGQAPAVPMAPPPDPTQAPVQGAGLQLPKPGGTPPPIDGSLAGAPNAQSAPAPITPPPTTPQPQAQAPAKPKLSQVYYQRAQAMRNVGGMKGIEASNQAMQMAATLETHEREQDLNDILSSNAPIAQKAAQIVGKINGSDTIPGQVQLKQDEDGLYLDHTADGKDGSYKIRLNGSNPVEALGDLANKYRAMHDSGLQYKLSTLGEETRHNKVTEDNANEKQLAQLRYAQQGLDYTGQLNAARLAGEAANLRATKAALGNGNWMPYGDDGKGNVTVFDNNTGSLKTVKAPDGVTPYNKVTGVGKAGAIHELTETQKIAYPKALDMIPPNATPAQKLDVARQFNLPPEIFGVPSTAIPSPMALGKPPASAAAPAPAKGLNLSSMFSSSATSGSGPSKFVPSGKPYYDTIPSSAPAASAPAPAPTAADIPRLRALLVHSQQMVAQTAKFPAQQQDWIQTVKDIQNKLSALQ